MSFAEQFSQGLVRDVEPWELDIIQHTFCDDVLEGLSRRPRTIPCKYFYDVRGAQLFEAICQQPEYYQTRTEIMILERHAQEIARLAGTGACLLELGSGNSLKTRILLKTGNFASYVPVDICRPQLDPSAAAIARDFPLVRVAPQCADFSRHFDIPAAVRQGRRIGFFPGSTIGNFNRVQAAVFLADLAKLLDPGGALLIGVDLKKDARTLLAAYNDAAGVTAQFNLNLLRRINRELGANFVEANFRHEAVYKEEAGRVEMHLISRRPHTVRVAGRMFAFAAEEIIHTEDCTKYSVEDFQALAKLCGFEPAHVWTDPYKLFSVHYLTVPGPTLN